MIVYLMFVCRSFCISILASFGFSSKECSCFLGYFIAVLFHEVWDILLLSYFMKFGFAYLIGFLT